MKEYLNLETSTSTNEVFNLTEERMDELAGITLQNLETSENMTDFLSKSYVGIDKPNEQAFLIYTFATAQMMARQKRNEVLDGIISRAFGSAR